MYKSISEKVLGVVGLTSIAILDNFLIAIAAILIHCSVYSIVGFLYDLDIISGRFMGKLCYFLIWCASLVGSVFLALHCQQSMITLFIVIGVLLVYNIVYGVVKFKLKA